MSQNTNTMISSEYTGPMPMYGLPPRYTLPVANYCGGTNCQLVPKSYLFHLSNDGSNVTIWANDDTNSTNECATIYGAAHYDSRNVGIPSESGESKSYELDSCESKCNDHEKTTYGRNGTCVPKYDSSYASGLSH